MAVQHTVLFLVCTSFLLLTSLTTAQYNFNPYYMYRGNNYMSSSVNSGMWWTQPRCHWGVTGYRSTSLRDCGTFQCPAMWYGNSQYVCPPSTMFSNSLQECVRPARLAKSNCNRASPQ